MKKIYTFITFLLLAATLAGQVPSSFKYQAVLRDARGNIKANTATSIAIDILSGSATGSAVYSETHNATTDDYGLINLEIGNGTAVTGSMSAIDWSTGIYFIKITVDGVEMGTSQLLSVPYAQYAKKSGNNFSSSDSAKLAGIAAGAEVNVNPDWNATSGDAQILNKPTIVNADGSETIVHGTAGSRPGNLKVTVTGTGKTSDPYIIGASDDSTRHFIGEKFGGGIVFYVYDNGRHGLIAGLEDLKGYNSEGVYDVIFQWWTPDNSPNNAFALGDGLNAGTMNTALIWAAQMASLNNYDGTPPSCAAQLCINYSTIIDNVTYGGWYLPSKYELNLLYAQKVVVGGFAEDYYYWSSTEYDGYNVWVQDFTDGSQYDDSYDDTNYVRPIRSF
jgi:hypothetical protein